ncbi:MAG: hydrogen gas-evolving membrane-bound hydrogenase subunit E [Verrucomicrobiota bacterium]
MLIPLSILLSLFSAALASPLVKRCSNWAPYILAAVPAGLFLAYAFLVGDISFANTLQYQQPWVPGLNVAFDFQVDGLSLLFLLMITGIGAFILIYAGGYLSKDVKTRTRFYTYMFLFMVGMIGLVSADNLVLLFIFWELTSISSYLLIGFDNENKESRKKALQALLVTGTGGVALLAGFILLGNTAGSYRLSEIIAQGEALATHPLGTAALILILLGAFTKSAQFPFHFWLPNAMAAPTPVSAYLHSATMVKAGIFLLFKLSPVFASHPIWTASLIGCGAITLLLGTISGIFQRDLKRILAFTTMAVLGLLTMLIGIGGELALKSALLFMLGHALYKATLFMTAGNIDHGTGTRDARILGGLRTLMPYTAVAAGLAALSKGGFPPLAGFLGKEYVYKTSSTIDVAAPYITVIALIGNALLLALAFKAGIHPYWSKAVSTVEGKSYSKFLPHKPHEANAAMLAGPLILAIGGLVFGLLPQSVTASLIQPALSAATNTSTEITLSLWHGFSLPLILSITTLIAGITIYWCRETFWKREAFAQEIAQRDTENIYEFIFTQFVRKSKEVTRTIQNGSLRSYLWTIILAAGALVGFKIISLGAIPYSINLESLHLFHYVLIVGLVIAVGFAAFASSLLKALAGLGLLGYGVAIIFATNGAPDLAITQIIVETLAVGLLLFAALRLPAFRKLSSNRNRILDTILASSCGLVAFYMALKASAIELSPTISNQFVEWSYVLAKGKNVVNVTLVDFRALDTFGEIAVIGIAAIGVCICLPVTNLRYLPSAGLSKSIIFSTGARILLPLCIALSVISLYRGHNEPGGGFIGGLICAAGFTLYAFARGTVEALRRLRFTPIQWIAGGLLIALASACFGPIVGKPFMTGLWLPGFELPILGTVHLGTPLLFDVGVYAVVVGFAAQVTFSFLDSSINATSSAPKQDPCSKLTQTATACK